MDCNQAAEQIGPYLLGALDSRERGEVEAHLQLCRPCSLMFQGEGETVSRLAFAVPQMVVPGRVKQRLLARIEADAARQLYPRIAKGLTVLWLALGRLAAANAAKGVAAALVVTLIFSAVWFNVRLNEVAQQNQTLNGQIETVTEKNQELNGKLQDMAGRESKVMEMVQDQRVLTYEALRSSATPGSSVNMLWGTGWTPGARGVMVSHNGAQALLLTLDLPPLPPDKVYQVWLIKDGQRYPAGTFTVDSTGFAQAVIIAGAPLTEFEAIGITIEPWEGSNGPTGTSVLKGDL